jgi:MFS family permease
LLWLALLVLAIEAYILIFYRQINLDEGWYLWAGKLVYEGKVPFRDFAFPQSPLLPYVYGIFQSWWGEGLLQGRFTTLLITCLNLALWMRLARRLGNIWTVVVFLWLLAGTLFVGTYHFAYVAPYALTAFFLTLSISVALSALPERRREVLAVIFWGLAVGTRLSVAVVIVPLGLYLLFKSQRRWRSTLVIGLTGALALGALFGPFFAAARDVLFYDLFGFHTDRMPLEWQWRAMRQSVLRLVNDFPVPLMLAGVGLVIAAGLLIRARDRRAEFARQLPGLLLGFIVAALIVAQLVPRTTDSYYNTLQMPLLLILDSLVICWIWRAQREDRLLRRISLLALVGLIALNGVLQAATVQRRNFITLPLRNQIGLAREAARFLQQNTPAGSQVLSFDTYLALEAQRRIPPGMEMSIFSYRPTWTTEQAQRYKVVNNERLLEIMRGDVGAAVFSEFDLNLLYGERELLLETLFQNFRWAKTVPGLGPFKDEVRIFLPPQYGAPNPQHARHIRLEDGTVLLGHEVAGTVRRGEPIRLTLFWQAAGDQQRSYTVFTHILDADGKLVGGWDNVPCHGTCPTTTWRPGEIVRDEYAIPTGRDWPAGEYSIEVGVYDSATGERVKVVEPLDPAAPGSAILGKIYLQ